MLSQKNMQLLNWLLAGSHFQPSQPVEALLVISVLKSRKGLGKVHKGHQDDLTLMTWIHRLSNLSGKFPVEAHKQVQADEFSPPTSTRRTALLKPCLYLKSQSETSVTQFFPFTFSRVLLRAATTEQSRFGSQARRLRAVPGKGWSQAGGRAAAGGQYLIQKGNDASARHSMLGCNLVPRTLGMIWCEHTQFRSCSEVSPPSSKASDVYSLSSWHWSILM